MIDNIIINSVIPLVFAYGLYHKNEAIQTKALNWLQKLPGEDNRIVQIFKQLKMKVSSAFDSQALVELKKEFCDCKRCLECAVGASVLKS